MLTLTQRNRKPVSTGLPPALMRANAIASNITAVTREVQFEGIHQWIENSYADYGKKQFQWYYEYLNRLVEEHRKLLRQLAAFIEIEICA